MSTTATEPDFDAAQEDLEKALETARAGEDKELAAKVREIGERLGKRLMGCIRLFQIHDKGNDAFNQPMEEFEEILTDLNDLLGAVHIVMVENQVYVNDIRVRFDPRNDAPPRRCARSRAAPRAGSAL